MRALQKHDNLSRKDQSQLIYKSQNEFHNLEWCISCVLERIMQMGAHSSCGTSDNGPPIQHRKQTLATISKCQVHKHFVQTLVAILRDIIPHVHPPTLMSREI